MQFFNMTKQLFYGGLLCVIALLLYVYYYNKGKERDVLHLRLPERNKFKPVNDYGLRTLRNVCIISLDDSKKIEIRNGVFTTEKTIIVFGAQRQQRTDMKVAASGSVWPDSWPIQFTRDQMPPDLHLTSYPAYFVITSYPGNLYHLWHDSTLSLYGAMKLTNRLNSSVPNQVLQRNGLVGDSEKYNHTRYADILQAFSVREDQNVYHAMPSGTCYPYGVFGYTGASQLEVVNYVTAQLDIKYPSICLTGVKVTILKRKLRRIQNRDALLQALLKAGFKAQLVDLADLSFKQQWEIIRCTDILVGVQGAGLQWVMFLQPHRALLELTYDNWNSMYVGMYQNFKGLATATLHAISSTPDWFYISKLYFNGRNLTAQEKAKVLDKKNRKMYWHLWAGPSNIADFKWANSAYRTDQFLEKIRYLQSKLGT